MPLPFSSWFCTSNTTAMLVKIVHPGGHVELHDRPVMAMEIMLRNPKCCVAYPHVFQEPWAVVPPETTLMLGKKFYVVPISTIRKLQRLSSKRPPSESKETSSNQNFEDREANDKDSACCLFPYSPKQPYVGTKSSDSGTSSSGTPPKYMEKDWNLSEESCFSCFTFVTKAKTDNEVQSGEGRSTTRTNLSSNTTARKRAKDSSIEGSKSPKKYSSFDSWQPSLESICEE
ncbi:PADRE domain [Dillenia turbinata]|uniref:PADRE domain n=1 Tax=Dillenia turbinata TaxID=194707 RepID=A0AAN8UE03_9MAGN